MTFGHVPKIAAASTPNATTDIIDVAAETTYPLVILHRLDSEGFVNLLCFVVACLLFSRSWMGTALRTQKQRVESLTRNFMVMLYGLLADFITGNQFSKQFKNSRMKFRRRNGCKAVYVCASVATGSKSIRSRHFPNAPRAGDYDLRDHIDSVTVTREMLIRESLA